MGGVGIGYLRPDQFLDQLTMIKIQQSFICIFSVQKCLCQPRLTPSLRSTSTSRFTFSLKTNKQTKSLQSNVVTFQPCYLYECITPLRALMLQKTAPSKWKVQKKIQLQIHPKSKEQSHYFASQTLMKMESHIDERRGTQAWEKTQATVVDVMKKTLGIMVCWGLPKNN